MSVCSIVAVAQDFCPVAATVPAPGPDPAPDPGPDADADEDDEREDGTRCFSG